MLNNRLIEKYKKFKEEEFNYIGEILEIRSERLFTESEKLEIYRNILNYQKKENYIFDELKKQIYMILNCDNSIYNDLDQDTVIFEIDMNESFKSILSKFDSPTRENILNELGINPKNNKYQVSLYNLYSIQDRLSFKNIDIIINQPFMDKPIYCYSGIKTVSNYYDLTRMYDDIGVYALYYDLFGNYKTLYGEDISKLNKEIKKFEKDNTILKAKTNVPGLEIINILNNELLNVENKTLDDCINVTINQVNKLNYLRSPEYKEDLLLDRINELYKKVKGECINKELLYSGEFLDIIRETYKLNDRTVEKEKVIKNKGKDSVVVIGVTSDNKYILTFQNRIDNELIAEFPAGYIENNETVMDAAKRELEEETGYTSNNLMLLDEVYPISGIDNSKTYIVVADDCIKDGNIKTDGNELVSYDLFTQNELDYLFYSDIIKGSLNKLAYYNLNRTKTKGHKNKDGKRKSLRYYKKNIIPKEFLIRKE